MVRTLYVSNVLALALFAGQSDAAATGSKAMARRQPFEVGQPFGAATGSSSFTSSQSESHYESVTDTFNGLVGKIQSCQSSFQKSSFTEQVATQQIQLVASHFEAAFDKFHDCGTCMGGDQIGKFRQTFTEIFSSFHSLVDTCKQRFPNRWQFLFEASFSRLQDDFGKFFSTCQSGGLKIDTFVPSTMGTFFAKTSMTSTLQSMRRIGYSP